jgi:hypothetical protein
MDAWILYLAFGLIALSNEYFGAAPLTFGMGQIINLLRSALNLA